MWKDVGIFSGNSNPELSKAICDYLHQSQGDCKVGRFSEGEIEVKINEDVRGKDVFVIQSTCPSTNENIMELLILIDALRRASAARITAVIPYYGYARQDRKDQPRVPITAKLIANLITEAGANRVLTLDLHAGQIQGFFDIPLDHLYAVSVAVDYIKKKIDTSNIVVVSPDVGGIKMARAYAKQLNSDLAIVDKRRLDTEKTEVLHFLGDVAGKDAIIIDDIVATGGSLAEAAGVLKDKGADQVYASIVHPILSGPAIERLESSIITKLFVSDSIPVLNSKNCGKIEIFSIASLLGEAIKRIHNNESVSELFK